MTRIPTSALLLGLAGLIPFLWGASSSAGLLLAYMPLTLPPAFTGTAILTAYGTVILSFMAGVIWGFAAKAQTAWMPLGLALSTLPALWIFFFSGQPDTTRLITLVVGFVGLLAIDIACARKGLAPEWWIPLRLLLTSVVVFCLVIGFLLAP
ncbi:DUF3429 domain-containing protein [Gymnodinialimonas sp.]